MLKRLVPIALLALLGLQVASPALAARRVVVKHGPHQRTTVVVHRGWPLRRPARVVVVHPARTAVHIEPIRYFAPVVFAGIVVGAASAPARDILVWEDAETLVKEDGWTEFTLNVDSRGTRLWIEVVSGRIQADWAEVVYENGDTQVVDLAARTIWPGLYSLLDFRDGRRVDHVRMVARARTPEARIALRMEK